MSVFLLVACYFPASGQKSVSFSFDTSFHKQGSCSFSTVTVIDNQRDKSKIGIIGSREFKKERVIAASSPLDSMLATLASDYIKDVPKGNASCLLVVRDFTLRFTATTPGTFYFSGDIFLGQGPDYKLVKAVDTLVEFNGGIESGEDVSATLVTDLLKSAGDTTYAQLSGITYTLEAAKDRFSEFYKKYPIYTTTDIHEGMYSNVDEFLQNAPGTTVIHRKDKPDHVGRHRPPITTFYDDDNGERADRINKMFAIYSKKEWFVLNRSKKFAKMVVREGDFYRVVSLGYIRSDVNGRVAGISAIFGGVILAIPTAIISNAVIHNSSRVQRNGVYEARFNPERKQFMPVSKITD